jgi:hypothetical protein
MAISKADPLACPRGFAEPHFIRIHKLLERPNLDNRTESAKSRALERIEPFSEKNGRALPLEVEIRHSN